VFEIVKKIVRRMYPERADTEVCPYKIKAVALVAAAVVLTAGTAIASNPASPTPDVPPAALCTVTAPSFEELNSAILTPVAGASPVAARTPGVVPDGAPADAETVVAVAAVVRELVGCYNAGEPLRTFALFTDSYLSRLYHRQGGFTQASYDSYATPQPAADPSTHTAILAITDVRVLEDRTVGATVVLRYASVPMPKTFFVTFVREGERWLIDGILGEISFSVP
jgi:hypothetical protein